MPSYFSSTKPARKKGKSLFDFPDDYVLIDVETTGVDPRRDSMIEFAAIKVKNNEVIGEKNFLIYPEQPSRFHLSSFITSLTGITKDMLLKDGIPREEALFEMMNFIHTETILGYNVNFDINFVYDFNHSMTGTHLSNDFVDALRLSRKIHSNFRRHRLQDMLTHYQIEEEQEHRALRDCVQTKQVYDFLRKDAERKGLILSGSVSKEKERNTKNSPKTLDAASPFKGQSVCFTGKLDTMDQKTAMRLVLERGGIPQINVTKKTTLLVTGAPVASRNSTGYLSEKVKKAQALIQEGYPIRLIDETIFLKQLSK